jgi:hypothetical protein
MKPVDISAPDHLKYRDPEFSDVELEVMLRYFNMSRYEDLRSLLETRKKSFAITG